MNEGWIRARSSEQIEKRMQAILDAAGRVFHHTAYENVTMQMIAKEAGFTRSNIYRYFNTREEIFLKLLLSDMDKWVIQVMSVFTKEIPLETFVKKWTALLCRQNRLLELSPLLSLFLEKNSSEDIYRNTKRTLTERLSKVVTALQKAIPSLTIAQWYEFLLTQQSITAGAWPMAQYTDMQLRVIDELDLPHLKIDFTAFYKKAILIYLRGLIANSKSNDS